MPISSMARIHGSDLREVQDSATSCEEFSAAELGALAHLYRGEVYRSTIWRTRLDTTTNWAVVVTGISFTIAFGSSEAPALPLVLVGLLVLLFLMQEARRYRYFNVWRARARLMETDFYAPLLRGPGGKRDGRWERLLADDYHQPKFHISYLRAVGRRLRKNYCWIFSIQAVAYVGKIMIHPGPLTGASQILERAAIGAIPGVLVVAAGVAFHSTWIIVACWTWLIELHSRRDRRSLITIS